MRRPRSRSPDLSRGAEALMVDGMQVRSPRSQNNLRRQKGGRSAASQREQGSRVEVSTITHRRRSTVLGQLLASTDISAPTLAPPSQLLLGKGGQRLRASHCGRAYQGLGGLLIRAIRTASAPEVRRREGADGELGFPLQAPQSRGDGAKVDANGRRGVATCETGPSRRSVPLTTWFANRASGKSSAASTWPAVSGLLAQL